MHQHVLDDGFYVLVKFYSNYMDTLMHDSDCQTRTMLFYLCQENIKT